MQLTEIHSSDLFISFDELCTIASINVEHMLDMVEFEIAVPISGTQPQEWRFPSSAISRASKATRLYRDLEIDWADIKLVLTLLDLIEDLQNENNQLKRQLKRF